MVPERGVRRNPNVVWRRETKGGTTEGVLLFNYETRNVHFLDGISKRIWEECEDVDIRELEDRIGAKGHEGQVAGFLGELEKRRLVFIE